jgi:uncharacterized membrane protein
MSAPPDPTLSSQQLMSDTAMVHLYRAEMNRMTVWRQRLDITSNWAIILTTGLTTFTLGTDDVPHYTLLLGLALIAISIMIEGRRYRHLYHSKWRLYLMEFGYFAEMLHPADREHPLPNWRHILAADLRHAHFMLPNHVAWRVRLRRNYLLLVYFVTAVWFVKLFIHPSRPLEFGEFWERLWVGQFIPPWFVAATAVLFVGGATLAALTCPVAEKLEDWSGHYTLDPGRHPPEAEIPPEPDPQD